MQAQIIAILLAVICYCEATYLPETLHLSGSSFAALGLNYPASPILPYNAYAVVAVPGAVKANYLPGTSYSFSGPSYAGALGLNYAESPVAAVASPLSAVASPVAPVAYTTAYNPAAPVKVTYSSPSNFVNYIVVNDVADPSTVSAPDAAKTETDPTPVVKDAASRYVTPLRYNRNVYLVKK